MRPGELECPGCGMRTMLADEMLDHLTGGCGGMAAPPGKVVGTRRAISSPMRAEPDVSWVEAEVLAGPDEPSMWSPRRWVRAWRRRRQLPCICPLEQLAPSNPSCVLHGAYPPGFGDHRGR